MKFLTLFSMFFFTVQSSADTFVIPSPTKTQRSVHGTAAAAAWSDRHRLNTEVQSYSNESEFDGSPSSESDGHALSLNAFHRVSPGLAIEAWFGYDVDEDKDLSDSSTDEDKTTDLLFNAGFSLSENFVLGLGISKSDTESENSISGKSTNDEDDVELTAGFRSGNLYYLAGFELEDSNSNGFTDKEETLILGFGHLVENRAAEVVLRYSNEDGDKSYLTAGQYFLTQGSSQHIMTASYSRVTNSDSTKIYSLGYTLDKDLDNFYIAPGAGAFLWKGNSFDFEFMVLGIEVGKRSDSGCDYYGNISYTLSDSDGGSESSGLSLAAGLSKSF